MKVDVALFAHNEEKVIIKILEELCNQTIAKNNAFNLNIHILANGCTDKTVALCNNFLSTLPTITQNTTIKVDDLHQGGKSRTWNYYVHNASRKTADYWFFIDADITITNKHLLEKMINALECDSKLKLFSSRPIKDIDSTSEKLNLVEKSIALSGNSLGDYKKSICGQLYIVRPDTLASIYMPIGLPVEDGFLRAMLLTDLLTQDEDFHKLHGEDQLFHHYESIRSISELIKHQTRLIIGSAINDAIFTYLRKHQNSISIREEILKDASKKENWLEILLEESLPKAPYGYVPFHFLFKRIKFLFQEQSNFSAKKLLVAFLGLGLDTIVYINATQKMLRRKGVGYW